MPQIRSVSTNALENINYYFHEFSEVPFVKECIAATTKAFQELAAYFTKAAALLTAWTWCLLEKFGLKKEVQKTDAVAQTLLQIIPQEVLSPISMMTVYPKLPNAAHISNLLIYKVVIM